MQAMRSIDVPSLPIALVIQDIARALHTEFSQDCEVYHVELPPAAGKGYIKGISYDNGLGMIFYDCCFSTDVELCFTVNDIHPAKFLYVLEGSVEHAFSNDSTDHMLMANTSAIVASSKKNGHVLRFKADERVLLGSLEVDRKRFIDQIHCSINQADNPLVEVLEDVDANRLFFHEGSISMRIFNHYHDIYSCTAAGIRRNLFFIGKCYLLLEEQFAQYKDDIDSTNVVLRKSDTEAILKAIRFLESNLSASPTGEHLARIAGVNENKLQQGFKQLTGGTFHAYLQQLRIKVAAQLLAGTDLSIAEIVFRLGLTNGGYFSRLFKTHFGMSPSEYRKQTRK